MEDKATFDDYAIITPLESNIEMSFDAVVSLISDMEKRYKFLNAYHTFIVDNLQNMYPESFLYQDYYHHLQKLYHHNLSTMRGMNRRIDYLQREVCIAEMEFRRAIQVPLKCFDYINADVEIPDYFIWIGKENCL